MKYCNYSVVILILIIIINLDIILLFKQLEIQSYKTRILNLILFILCVFITLFCLYISFKIIQT